MLKTMSYYCFVHNSLLKHVWIVAAPCAKVGSIVGDDASASLDNQCESRSTRQSHATTHDCHLHFCRYWYADIFWMLYATTFRAEGRTKMELHRFSSLLHDDIPCSLRGMDRTFDNNDASDLARRNHFLFCCPHHRKLPGEFCIQKYINRWYRMRNACHVILGGSSYSINLV